VRISVAHTFHREGDLRVRVVLGQGPAGICLGRTRMLQDQVFSRSPIEPESKNHQFGGSKRILAQNGKDVLVEDLNESEHRDAIAARRSIVEGDLRAHTQLAVVA
jgi:hypothetical protein